MTEKKISVFKLFFVIKYFRFYFIFYVKIATPWKKLSTSFSPTPSKSWGPIKPPFFEDLVGGSTPPSRKGGAHYETDNGHFIGPASDE